MKKRAEALVESQRGSLNKLIIKEKKDLIENHDVDIDAQIGIEILDNEDPNDVFVENDNAYEVPAKNDNCDDVHIDNDDDTLFENINLSETYHFPNIYDPRTWDGLNSKMIDLLVKNGPKRDHSLTKVPKDNFSRRFTANLYTRVLLNEEKCDRDWLVYWKELDRIFCFCCKIYKKGNGRGQLTNEDFSDWGHVGLRLKEHETSIDHVKNMTSWYELRLRFQKNQILDKTTQTLIEKEKDH